MKHRRSPVLLLSATAFALTIAAFSASAAFDFTTTKLDNSTPPLSNGSSSNGRVPLGSSGRGDDAHVFTPSVLKDGGEYRMWYTGYEGSDWEIFYATSDDGLVWTKYGNAEPTTTSDGMCPTGMVLRGSNGRGDDAHVRQGYVLRDDDRYWMWYVGYDGSFYRIYCATSHNGLAWTKVDNTTPGASDGSSSGGRIPVGTGGTGDDGNVIWGCVVKDGADYKMWYSGNDGSTWRIFHATSSNGLDWVKYDNSVAGAVLPYGAAGTGDETGTYSPWVMKDGPIYRMWYSGRAADNLWRMYHATSSNGIDWIKYDNTIPAASDGTTTNGRIALGTAATGDDNYAITVSVLQEDVYRIWYSGHDGSNYRIYYATQEAPTPIVSNAPAANVTTVAADLVGNLASTGDAPTEVYVYWGTNDGADVKGDWWTNDYLDTNNLGLVTNSVSGLTSSTRYYYRFYATNASGDDWANDTEIFSALGTPVLDNDGGATNLSSIAARMRGEVLSGGPTPKVYICWATSNVVSTSTGDWDNVEYAGEVLGPFFVDVGGLSASQTYYYRCFATNLYGGAWAPTVTNFTTPGGVTRRWNGDGNWQEIAKWNPPAVPGPLDHAIVESGSVLLDGPTTNGSLQVDSGATLTFTNWMTELVVMSNVVVSGTVTVPPAFSNGVMSNRVWITCSNLTLSSGGEIDTDGRGFAAGWRINSSVWAHGSGPGGGRTLSTAGGGGGHGGVGGGGYNGGAGGTYGLTNAPLAPGSGGGTSTAYGSAAGSGGGAVRINASGTVTVDGTITADAVGGTSRGGGGSGGSIYITCHLFAGTGGRVSAKSYNVSSIGGAGGGGRIAVVYDTVAQAAAAKPTVDFSVMRGTSTSYGGGSMGTLYLPDMSVLDPAWLPHDAILHVPTLDAWSVAAMNVSNGWLIVAETAVTYTVTGDLTVRDSGTFETGPGSDVFCGGDVVITNGSSFYIHAGATNGTPFYGALLSVTGDLVVADSSTFLPVSERTNGGSPFVTCRNVLVDGTSQLNANSKGFGACLTQSSNGYGPGKGKLAGGYGGGGGGYGGKGGANNQGENSRGVTYGDSNAPVLPGSGAGCQAYGSSGGYGGGLIRIDADQAMAIAGSVTANGQNGSSRAGGGSGGGVYLRARVFDGGSNCVLSAEGGNPGSWAGSGGGGRIAVHAGRTTFDGGATVTNGTGSYGVEGEVGTVVWVDLAPAISNVAATNISGTEAWLVGNLWSTGGIPGAVDGAPSEVYVFWGTNNGETVKGDWETNDYLGFHEVGALSNKLTTLSPQTQYYFRFYSTNTWGDEWAGETVNFGTVGGATVNNEPGATNVGQTVATLQGDVTSGNPIPEAYFCWGDNDPAVDSTGAWDYVVSMGPQLGPFDHTVSNLLANKTYYYRCFTTNTFGPGWAATVTNFTTESPDLWIGDVSVVEGAVSTTTNAVFAVTISSTSAVPVSVEFSAAAGTATIGSDLDATNGTLVIPAGSVAESITVVVNGDGLDEFPNEDFLVNLSNATLVAISDGQGHGLIVDDDDVYQAKVWTGVGNWTSYTNWTPVGRPSPSDDVLIDGDCTLSNSESVASLVVSNAATFTFTNWTVKLTATQVGIQNGGTVTLPPPFPTAGPSNRVWIACSNLTVSTGGSVDVREKGFARGTPTSAGQGPGGGGTGGNAGGGAGHGARGGGGYNGGAGASYGNATAPEAPGSGGGGCSAYPTFGEDGGGVVRIEASGSVTVDGTIAADGGDQPTSRGAGGSGGSVYITCRTFEGTAGTVSADGGQSGGIAGAPAGGRIAVLYNTSAQAAAAKPSVRFTVDKGWGGYDNGDLGTLYFPDVAILDNLWMPHNGTLYMDGVPRWAPDQLIISNGFLRIGDAGLDLEITNDLEVTGGGILQMGVGGNVLCGGNLLLTNSSKLYVYAAATNGVAPLYGVLLSVTNDVTIADGAQLVPVSQNTNGGSPLLRMQNLTIDAGGQINADAGGYAGSLTSYTAGHGPGKGAANGNNNPGGGGGYGGHGGAGASAGGVTYGSSNAPVNPGSGGGAGAGAGGYGGGLARIEARGSVTVDGTISANGRTTGGSVGGGAGGGIFVWCRNFSGGTGGVLRVDGGGGGGGGGGGRIAVWYRVPDDYVTNIIEMTDLQRVIFTNSVDTYEGSVSVLGGTGSWNDGADGTYIFITVTPPRGTLLMLR